MTEASTGLRKALARGANVSALSPEELLAQMTDEQKTALAASLAPAANAGEAPKPEADATDDEDEDDLEMGEKKSKEKEYAADDKAKAATDRALAVMSSEHFAGREAQAKTLLANDKLSADEIITMLADLKPAASADPEADARAEMQAALKDSTPPTIDANAAPGTTPAQAAGSIWDKTYAKLGYVQPAA